MNQLSVGSFLFDNHEKSRLIVEQLITTKLYIPPTRPKLVSRQLLIQHSTKDKRVSALEEQVHQARDLSPKRINFEISLTMLHSYSRGIVITWIVLKR
jgi:hypothetical protein